MDPWLLLICPRALPRSLYWHSRERTHGKATQQRQEGMLAVSATRLQLLRRLQQRRQRWPAAAVTATLPLLLMWLLLLLRWLLLMLACRRGLA